MKQEEELQYRYYHDSAKTYLVIRCQNAGKSKNRYQYRMLAANPMEGLPDATLRRIDGEEYLYYDVTQLQSVRSMFDSRRADTATVRTLLDAMVQAGDSIARYLLDRNRIQMKPELIFYQYETGTFRFIYLPDASADTEGLRPLLDFLAQHTDPGNRDLIRALYRLGDLSARPNYVLRKTDFDRILASCAAQERPNDDCVKDLSGESIREQQIYFTERETDPVWRGLPEEPEHGVDGRRADLYERNDAPIQPEKPDRTAEKRHPMVRMMMSSVIFLILAALLEVGSLVVNLNARASLITRALIVTFLFLAVALAAWGTWCSQKKKRDSSPQKEEDDVPMAQAVPDRSDYRRQPYDSSAGRSYRYPSWEQAAARDEYREEYEGTCRFPGKTGYYDRMDFRESMA